jgi:transposase
MIPMPAEMRIWVACGTTDMRRGFDGLAMMVQNVLKKSPYCGHMFVFRGKRADRIKILWWDGTGLCLVGGAAVNIANFAEQVVIS